MSRGRAVFDDAGQPVTFDLDGPCSTRQWGRIQGELDRLGVADRDERLALAELLAGLDGAALASTRDLTAGQAGQVVRQLAGCRTLSDAYRVADEPRRARQWARMRARLARQLGERMVADHGTAER